MELVTQQYEKYFAEKNKKVIYHFKYKGLINGRLKFEHSVLSEKNSDKELFETFDKIHNEHVDIIKKDIDKLKDISYYKKFGLKRKKGYLFYGFPGCGKSATVVAMALYDSRHVIDIPFSIIKYNDEFEQIMNLSSINNIPINKNNIILYFDELDVGFQKISNRYIQNESTEEQDNDSSYENDSQNSKTNISNSSYAVVNDSQQKYTKTKKDKDKIVLHISNPEESLSPIDLGVVLSSLDGVGNYNGLIIVATTNCIDKIDKAVYRDMRLTPLEFNLLRKIDCENILKMYFGDYEPKYNSIIVDRKMTPSKLVSLCSTYSHYNVDQFFTEILEQHFL
jgi:SpoVK/Ycf46/Vps4 family AAA+-type ATPase